MRLLFMTIAGWALCWGLAVGQPVRFVEPNSLSKEARTSSLPEKYDEKVAVTATADAPRAVPGAMSAIAYPYDAVKKALLERIEKDIGVERMSEGTDEPLIRTPGVADSGLSDYEKKRMESNEKRLEAAGIRLTSARASRLITKPYNRALLRTSASQATFWIVDATELFQCACTLVVVSRTDWEVGILFQHNRAIPHIGEITHSVFTSREARLVESALETLGIRGLVFFPFYEQSLVPNASDLVLVKRLVHP